MTSQEQLAREWAQKIMSNEGNVSMWESTRAAAEFILANTRKPTMDEVEWSHKEHSLQGATDRAGDELVMHCRLSILVQYVVWLLTSIHW